MDSDEIKRMYEWIQGRVMLAHEGDGVTISFDEPNANDFAGAGFDPEVRPRTTQSPASHRSKSSATPEMSSSNTCGKGCSLNQIPDTRYRMPDEPHAHQQRN